VPVVGYLGPGTPDGSVASLAAFRKGLAETSFVEGRNVTRTAYRDASIPVMSTIPTVSMSASIRVRVDIE